MPQSKPSDATITRAGEIIRAGGLVAFPTETVYGLGADATNDRAVARIFAAKGRPEFNPLIVHGASREALEALVVLSPLADKVADRFWPGPLSLILSRRADCPVSRLCSAGLDTLAVRLPAHPLAQRFLAAANRPIAAPSANRSGGISPTRAEHVTESLGEAVDMVLDGGACPGGLESTVLDMTSDTPTILRPGLITEEELSEVVGPLTGNVSNKIKSPSKSPGQLASHYAPATPVRLNARGPANTETEEALLAFGPNVPEGFAVTSNLSIAGDLIEAATNLFALLHQLDRAGMARIAVMPVPEAGLGVAINDRLRRAAAPRPNG